ncbi:unnamed protein product [Kuraishia capsulata CBS 1993]|uniref:NADPH--cytochrome P450 reductase n=1 Tax=Kuraishia capsulata CBS 1993 TaxID=1382522 RepID=W6MLI2_9ASCO|nr:uncharacterized protein KUCA_T00002950001 [Kuraishia capsulata CBS 1993]CDK26973.1 unnamed protein product [Kuraishia capsulata CBS 1993]
MALDLLDVGVLALIVLGLTVYLTKGIFWGQNSGASAGVSASTGSRNLVEVLKQTNKKALVFYGSQTGTAEDYATKYAKELQSRFSIPTICADLSDYDFDNLNEVHEVPGFTFITFLMATYGEGEPTDDAGDFFSYLDDECENLENLKFACFGLGNSTYEIYNAMGKRTVARLTELGATLIGELGEGDDGQGTMDEDYLAWKDSLFEVLREELHLEEHDVSYEPGLAVIENSALSSESASVSLGEPDSKYVNPQSEEQLRALTLGPFDHSHPYLAPVTSSKELFNSETRHCIHAEFDLSGTNLRYSTGDHLAIWPSNSLENTAKFLSVLGISEKKDTVIDIKSLDSTVHSVIPSPTTYAAVVGHYLEISGPVSRQFLKMVVPFAPDAESKSKASALADSKELFHNEVTEKYLNIADALSYISNGKPWSSIPFSFVIESIAHLQPRYYSISSSSLSEKQTVHVTAVVEWERPNGSDHDVTGVATNLLWNIQLEQSGISKVKPPVTYDLEGPRGKFAPLKLPIHIRRSTFKLPTNPATPVIMVGPGTGVAPFRGFLRERVKQVENGVSVGKTILFYGSRSSKEDFLYKDEFPQYSKKLGDKFELITAFSRETSKKVYVQHKMAEKAAEIDQLLKQNAFFYVCGDASKMARDVQSTLVEILKSQRKLSESVASEMVRNFKVSNRYQEDVW